MHGMYLAIKIWSDIKTSSCFHFVAACHDDLTYQDKTSGLGKKKYMMSNFQIIDFVEEKQQISNRVPSQ